jgi:hypothetical protein
VGTTTPNGLLQVVQNNGSDLLPDFRNLSTGPGVTLNLTSTGGYNARTFYRNSSSGFGWYSGLNADSTTNYSLLDDLNNKPFIVQRTAPTNTLFLSSAGAVSVNNNLGGNGSLVVNQPNSAGDIFDASQSGNTKFVITNTGNVGYRDNIPRKNAAYRRDFPLL